ncbi:thiamine phosphate synthase [Engelhardtia mirabilis]|uniref:thiamine phosphate synthase n=1 Tax=Engelhardtia mirabilis TaxID=2528011 RepID=UPI003AF3CD0F
MVANQDWTPPPLVALTPGNLTLADCAALVQRCEAAVAAGLRGVLLRERCLFDRDFLALAGELRRKLGAGGWLGIHDRAHLFAACDGDALHLGWWSLEPSAARTLVGEAVPIGFSAHADDPQQNRQGCDYLLLAPVAATRSHPDPEAVDWRAPLGVDGFESELRRDGRPTWALGGVDATNAAALRRAGAKGIAVLGAILGQSDPGTAARGTAALLDAWENDR